MPGEVSEKSSHFIYLKDFRTQQCPDFLQHKCSHHRPYNCFSWHFVNQKRRRPFKKSDGKFNYNPDVYCSVYDETTGICPMGDECSLLHRVAGDVERRYHPRYFKTCMCVHETDAKGHCVKNGPHCAYAHGPEDLRMPVFDTSEDDNVNGDGSTNLLAAHLEKDIFYNEDPAWNDPHYVLINYKTEQCKRPHRLCRQGYACPSYHNPRDKRRSPKTFKYRSTPCPSVKRGDEWGDPPLCDVGDKCSYCHTRTEQQFHPEIYKSSKCNDMIQTGYCPRGQFCAFAHLEKELNEPWDNLIGSEASLSDFVEAVLPLPTATPITKTPKMEVNDICNGLRKSSLPAESHLMSIMLPEDTVASSSSPPPMPLAPLSSMNQTEPIGKRRTVSLSEGTSGPLRGLSTLHEKHAMKYLYDVPKENMNEVFPGSSRMNANANIFADKSIMSPKLSSYSFYPGEDTVESVIVNALDEEFVGGDLNISGYEREESDSLCSSLSTSFPSFGGYFSGVGSRPMSIPTSSMASNVAQQQQQHRQLQQQQQQQQFKQKEFVGSYNSNNPENSFMLFGRSYPSLAPIGSEHAAQLLLSKQQQQQQQQQAVTSQLMNELATLQNYPSQSSNQSSSSSLFPSSSLPLSQGISNLSVGGGRSNQEFEKMKEELRMSKMKMAKWEESVQQARVACNAWMKEVDDMKKQKRILEDERNIISRQRDDAVATVAKLTTELDSFKKSKATNNSSNNNEQQQQQQFEAAAGGSNNNKQQQQQQPQQQQQQNNEKDFTKLQQKRDMLKNELESIEELLKSHCSLCQKSVDMLVPLLCNKCFVCSTCFSTNSCCNKCSKQQQQQQQAVASSSDKQETK